VPPYDLSRRLASSTLFHVSSTTWSRSRGNAGQFGDCVASGIVVKDQAVADQAQRLHGMRGVSEGLLDVEQKRGQV
jgi:hypothetical protein